jgi:hypothetical protein
MTMYLVPRQHWSVPCGAHRTNGQPCGAWSIRGAFVCSAHGGGAPQVQAQAEFRLWRDRFWVRAARDISRGLREYDARLRAEPEAAHAETLAWLSQLDQRVRQFRRDNGRRPRRTELAEIFGHAG